MLAEAHLYLTGHVQGVGLRYNVSLKANELSLTGWIRNMPDGSVISVLQGEKNTINDLVMWLRKNTQLPKGIEIKLDWTAMSKKFEQFSILY